MRKNAGYIDCVKEYVNTKRLKPFYVVEYTLDYESNEEDRKILESLFAKTRDLAHKVVANSANNSAQQRSNRRIWANCLAGVLSEYFWRIYLNDEKEIVRNTVFESASTQIDLEIIDTEGKIEVRSSFPRNGVKFAICNIRQFKIIGPYSNAYKAGEVQKDFYVGALFPLSSPELILDTIKKDGFKLYLTGGASWDMMWDSNKSIVQNLIPDDVIGGYEVLTSYRVVPYSNALDSMEIKEMIYESIKPKYPILTSVPRSEQYIRYLPLYSIRAACGYFGEGEEVSELGWMEVEGIGRRVSNDMFIVQAKGNSMEPRIHDGDYCVFQANPAGSRQGMIVLAQHRGHYDDDNEGSFSIKEYYSEKKSLAFGIWRHTKIELRPLNHDYEPIEITEDDSENFRIVGEFICTLNVD